VRLALDEHYSKVIAEQLRDRGHDVVSVTERPELIGVKDDELFTLPTDRRAIVTENWPHFQLEMRRAEADGTTYYGVLFTSRKQPAEDALLNSYCWLPNRPQSRRST
jgi:Domain of unknown function (DUF5615)